MKRPLVKFERPQIRPRIRPVYTLALVVIGAIAIAGSWGMAAVGIMRYEKRVHAEAREREIGDAEQQLRDAEDVANAVAAQRAAFEQAAADQARIDLQRSLAELNWHSMLNWTEGDLFPGPFCRVEYPASICIPFLGCRVGTAEWRCLRPLDAGFLEYDIEQLTNGGVILTALWASRPFTPSRFGYMQSAVHVVCYNGDECKWYHDPINAADNEHISAPIQLPDSFRLPDPLEEDLARDQDRMWLEELLWRWR